MKKILNDETIIISPVKIYWDDLVEIHDRMKKGREIEVESGEYKYESLEELKDKTKKEYINYVKLIGRGEKMFKNSITIDIEPRKVWIRQDSESTETAAKIKELLIKKSPWYMLSPASPTWQGLSAVVGMVALITILTFAKTIDNIYLSLIMTPIGIAIMIQGFRDEPILGKSKIYTFLKKDKLSFWERNKDELLRGILIAIITGIISFFAGYLLSK